MKYSSPYSDENGFEDIIVEVIEAIDKGCPNLEVLWLCDFHTIEFDNGRIVFCNECNVYHLKKQRSLNPGKCPFEDNFTPEDWFRNSNN